LFLFVHGGPGNGAAALGRYPAGQVALIDVFSLALLLGGMILVVSTWHGFLLGVLIAAINKCKPHANHRRMPDSGGFIQAHQR